MLNEINRNKSLAFARLLGYLHADGALTKDKRDNNSYITRLFISSKYYWFCIGKRKYRNEKKVRFLGKKIKKAFGYTKTWRCKLGRKPIV